MERGKWTDKVQKEDFDQMIKKALVEIGIIIEGQAIELCPRDTGRLVGSITYATTSEQDDIRPDRNGKRWSEDKIKKPTNQYTLWIGTNTIYAAAVEYGQSARGSRQSLKTRRIYKATKGAKAQSYLRRALKETKKDVREKFRNSIKDMVRGK